MYPNVKCYRDGWGIMSFQEHKKHSQHHADKGGQMVPVQRLVLEDEGHDDGEDRQGNDLLDDFQLEQVKGSAVTDEANAVGGNHETVFKQGHAP